MAIKKGSALKNLLQYIWSYIDSWLDSWFKKIFFLLLFLAAQFLMFYLTAFFDVGLINWETSLNAMLYRYSLPGEKYPWDVFLVLFLSVTLISILVIWKNGTPPGDRNFKLSKRNTYGSGREISRRELGTVTEISHKNTVMGTILGQLDATGKQVLASKAGSMPNDNMLVFGPPGSGKSTSYVLPYIAQAIRRRDSICVSDTKGEVYAKTAELARQHGYKVLRLDLKDPEHSNGWNVLKELRHDDVRALIFSKTVMANTNTEGGKDIHAGAEESLLAACCLFRERFPKLEEQDRTFYGAFSMLLQSAEELDKIFTSGCSRYASIMQVVLESYSTFLQGSANLRGNVITNLANRIRVLATPAVKRMTSTDEIRFEDLGKEPTILYISMSDQHQTMSFLASLAFSFAFLDLVDLADRSNGQRLQVPVHFMMEEFGNLGYIPNIDKYLSTARSRGISINLVVQSLGQLVGLYEESMTNTILADCATWICLGCNDKSTAELLEWRSGEATIQVNTIQHDAVEPPIRLAHRHSSGDGRRNFYTSNDIMKIKARDEVFIVWQQLDSLKCKAFPIFQHQEFEAKHMPQITAASLIPLSNTKAKQIFQRYENERIQSFKHWMKNGGNPLKGCSHTEDNPHALPDIIPLHSLERMALAEAAGKVYDPTMDPDNCLYKPPKESNDQDNVIADEVWNLDGLVFEKEEPIAQEPAKTSAAHKAQQPLPPATEDKKEKLYKRRMPYIPEEASSEDAEASEPEVFAPEDMEDDLDTAPPEEDTSSAVCNDQEEDELDQLHNLNMATLTNYATPPTKEADKKKKKRKNNEAFIIVPEKTSLAKKHESLSESGGKEKE